MRKENLLLYEEFKSRDGKNIRVYRAGKDKIGYTENGGEMKITEFDWADDIIEKDWEVEFLEKHAEKIERFEKGSFLYKLDEESYVVENGKLVGKIDSKNMDDDYIPFSAAEFTRDVKKLREYK